MKSRKVQQVAVIVFALLAFLCFSLMDSVPDYSTPQDALMVAGYVLSGIAIYFSFMLLTGKPK